MQPIALFDRILNAKLCSYFELQQGSIADVFILLRIVDWREYITGYMKELNDR
jgi:hypothetical protein